MLPNTALSGGVSGSANLNPSIPPKSQMKFRFDVFTGERVPRSFIREFMSVNKSQLQNGSLIFNLVNYPSLSVKLMPALATTLCKSINPDPLVIMISNLTSDLPESLSTLVSEVLTFNAPILKDDGLLNVFISMMIFSGPLIVTSYLRGTGTHIGNAIDVKPLIAKDAHNVNLSPLYNARIDFLNTLAQWLSFIQALNVVVLVEENHIHIHKVSQNCQILPPGIYCKIMFNSKYTNDLNTSNLIQEIEGIKGKFNQTVLPITEYIDNFIKSGAISKAQIFPRSF